MKYLYPSVLFLVLGLFACSGATAPGKDIAKISVTGTAVKELEPDVTHWEISLRSEGEASEALARHHSQALVDLLDFLAKQNVPEDKIKTEQMRLSENWNYEHGRRFRQGFVASSRISFKSDIKSYTRLWSGLSAFKGLSIQSSSFELEDRVEAEKQVRKQALLAAREKARSMADVLDVSLGKPVYIEDLHWGDDVRAPQLEMARLRAAPEPAMVAPGTLDVRMRVRVDFKIK